MDGGAVLQTLVLSLGVLVLVGGVAWHAVNVLWERRLMLRRNVLVQLLSGRAVQGTLWARRRGQTVLKGATLFEPGADPKPMDGDVVLERGQIDYIQVAG